MAERKYLAFDLGAESGRAIIGRFNGGRLTLEDVHRWPNGPVNLLGSLHWDALRLFQAMKDGLLKAHHETGGDIAGLGLDTWGVDYGLLGKGDILLGNPFHYRDSRNDGIMEKAFQVVPKTEIFQRTGIQFMPFNTLYQLYSMVLAEHPLLGIAETFLTMPDLFNFLFTGRKACEFSNATTTQFYNPVTKSWATDLLERLSIPTHIFPEIVAPGTVIGDLLPSIQQDLGVGRIPVIAPACHDTGSAVAAVPAKGGEWAYISSGTWSLMGAEIPEALINDKVHGYNFTNEGGVYGTFRFLKNIMGLWLVQECRRQWEKEGDALDYAAITRMASEARPFVSLIQPDDTRFIGIGEMPRRIAAFCAETGQPAPDSKGAMVRCALESLALRYREVLDMLEDCRGRRIDTIHIVGGGTQNRLLNQFTANATSRPVVTGPIEATAIGNLVVQAIANGDLKDIAQARELIAASFPTETYEPADTADWEAAYARYRKLK